MFNACTSHIHYRLCRSFISPLHPPPPLMLDTLESEEYSPREWNRVDLCSYPAEEACHWSPLRLLVSLSLFLLPSVTHFTTSPTIQHLSLLPPTSIRTIFSPHPRWRSLFPQLYTLFFVLCSFNHSYTSSTTVTSYRSPTAHSAHLIKVPFRMLLQPPAKWASGVYFMLGYKLLKWKLMLVWTNWLCKVLACSLYFGWCFWESITWSCRGKVRVDIFYPAVVWWVLHLFECCEVVHSV